jgi:hypothetical protein
VPHPFRFFLRRGWEVHEFQVYMISETAIAIILATQPAVALKVFRDAPKMLP